MSTDRALLLLLHGEGWDELLMVAVGLVLAFVIISATGRRSGDTQDEAGSEAEITADDTRDTLP